MQNSRLTENIAVAMKKIISLKYCRGSIKKSKKIYTPFSAMVIVNKI